MPPTLAIPSEADQPKAEASATRNPGKYKKLDYRFGGSDERRTWTYFDKSETTC
jgi:hypothetical protein